MWYFCADQRDTISGINTGRHNIKFTEGDRVIGHYTIFPPINKEHIMEGEFNSAGTKPTGLHHISGYNKLGRRVKTLRSLLSGISGLKTESGFQMIMMGSTLLFSQENGAGRKLGKR